MNLSLNRSREELKATNSSISSELTTKKNLSEVIEASKIEKEYPSENCKAETDRTQTHTYWLK
jgi:hypothetical protein